MIRIGVAKAKLNNQAVYDPVVVSETLTEAISSWSGNDEGDLCSLINQGSTVVIKPNFVTHHNTGSGGMECLITNEQVIIEVLKKVAFCKPKSIILGDAPVQGCIWDKLITDDMRKCFQEAVGSIPFQIKDFRRTIYNDKKQIENQVPLNEFIMFDLKKNSFLEEISGESEKFRVTMYDHRKLNARHSLGKHQYSVSKDVIDADVVISLPKLKTHKKAGVTAALKNVVGINGNKEFLPHHRKGGTSSGGDCYFGRSIFKAILESLEDLVCMCRNTRMKKILAFSKRFLFYVYRIFISNYGIEGSWYGNDTVWRTTLDLNRILYFGTANGVISDQQQRKVLSVTDAIICGEGEGPLNPTPLYIGVITVTERPDIADYLHATMLGISPKNIPLIANAGSLFMSDQSVVVFEGKEYQMKDSIFKYTRALMPKGWQNQLNT